MRVTTSGVVNEVASTTVVAPSRAKPAGETSPSLAPSVKQLDLATLPEAARRELTARLAHNGIDPRTPNLIEALAAAELARAQSINPRVTAAHMQRAVARSAAAEKLVPA